jgi:hypothetical protein
LSNHTNKVLGTIFMIISGLIFTIERCVASISDSLIVAGHASHGMAVAFTPEYPSISDNFFVLFFLILGILIFAYGLIKKN